MAHRPLRGVPSGGAWLIRGRSVSWSDGSQCYGSYDGILLREVFVSLGSGPGKWIGFSTTL